MIRLLAMLGLLIVLAPVSRADAEIGTLPGWARQLDDMSVLMSSPADSSGQQVMCLVRLVQPVPGNVEVWFRGLTQEFFSGSVATVVEDSGLAYEQDLMVEAFRLRRPDRVIKGYETVCD